MQQKKWRLVVYSDQAIYLRGLETMLVAVSGFDLVGEAHSGVEIVQLCQMARPEIALIHHQDRGGNLTDLLDQVCQQPDLLAVILLAEFDDEISEEHADERLFFLSSNVTEDEFKSALEKICADLCNPSRSSGERQAIFAHTQEEEDELDGELGHFTPLPRSEELLSRELAMAGKIQATILPEEPPKVENWDISAILLPARETSGDFFDFIPMAYGKWGIVVADVTDKGMGAALFMALSSTLIRTYAARFPTLPALTMDAVNERILSDTRGNMFVSAVFAILEPYTGRLVFANAGHPPGVILTKRSNKTSIQYLRPTGMVLGVSEQANWKQKSMRMSPGDTLVLYTDGIIEAQSPMGEFYGEERLLDVLLADTDCGARAIQDRLVESVQHFVGSTYRQDDIAVIVIRRDV